MERISAPPGTRRARSCRPERTIRSTRSYPRCTVIADDSPSSASPVLQVLRSAHDGVRRNGDLRYTLVRELRQTGFIFAAYALIPRKLSSSPPSMTTATLSAFEEQIANRDRRLENEFSDRSH